jgi:hypothetical protein
MRPDADDVGGSRLRLSMPDELDDVLSELSALTGRSKSSFALEALSWYLPKLHALAVELRALCGGGVRRAARDLEAGKGVDTELPLTRQRRRALERQASKGRDGRHRA